MKNSKQLDEIIKETEAELYKVEVERSAKINRILYLQQRILDARDK